jgi:hypothetical protein
VDLHGRALLRRRAQRVSTYEQIRKHPPWEGPGKSLMSVQGFVFYIKTVDLHRRALVFVEAYFLHTIFVEATPFSEAEEGAHYTR